MLVSGGRGADASRSLRAYRDSDLLDRYHLPFMGGLAQRWVEEE